jgi:hypothetical protein
MTAIVFAIKIYELVQEASEQDYGVLLSYKFFADFSDIVAKAVIFDMSDRMYYSSV